MQAGTIAVGLLIFDGVEVLDACGPFEVFGTAGGWLTDAGEPVSRVVTVARSPQVVVARHGLRIVPDATLADDPPFDVLVVPGGLVDAVSSDTEVTGLVAGRHATSRLTLSACAGAFILGEAGLPESRPATTHWSDEDELERRWPSAGIDASLHVLRRLLGSELAELTARRMEYAWHDLPICAQRDKMNAASAELPSNT